MRVNGERTFSELRMRQRGKVQGEKEEEIMIEDGG